MTKTLITHINPHLDDIFAIWLLQKFNPEYKQVKLEFISARHKGEKESADRVFIGTGGGRFDEHKEGLKTCAGSLVYDYLKQAVLIPKDEILQKALQEMVEWNEKIDTGVAPTSDWEEYSIQSFIRTKESNDQLSEESLNLGLKILDRVLVVLKDKQQSLIDWDKRIEFNTKFGKSFAIKSETIDRAFCKRMGGDLFLIYNPKYRSVQYFTPSQTLDLSSIYEKVKSLDPKASWFLHQSHHMVLCGSSSAPDSKPTKLSFEQLMEIIESLQL